MTKYICGRILFPWTGFQTLAVTEDAIWIVGPGQKQRVSQIPTKSEQRQESSNAHPIVIEFKNVHEVAQLERRHAPNKGTQNTSQYTVH